MIVKCEQCQTKFKIPDDKVTDKGVKVRCTKCSHTFRVTKESAVAAGGAPSGAFPPASAAPPSGATQKLTVPPKAVALDSADPFSKFGQSASVPKEEQTRPGVFALGVEASRMPDLARPVPPAPAPPAPAPAASSSPFDFGSLAPPAPAKPSAPAAAPAPFDFASLMGPPSAGAPPPPARSPAPPPPPSKPPPGPSPFDFSALTAPPPPEPAPAPAPSPRMSAPARPIDAPAMSFDFSSLGPPPAVGAAPPPAPPPPSSMLPDLMDADPPPPAQAATDMVPALGDDFFASAATQNHTGPLPTVAEGATKEEARNALFDMSAAAPPEAPASVAPAEAPAAPAPEQAVPSSSPSGVIQLQRPPDPATERGRRVLGIVVNVLIAAVLVVGLVVVATASVNEGKLDMQSIGTSLKALVAPSSDFTAEDISNGLYDTKMGRPVFFVRGVVTNRSAATTRVRVKAEILDGATLVRSAEVIAGAPPSPEELNRLVGVAELKVLMDRTSTKAPSVESGGVAPFLVTFAEYPPDLKAFRVRVTATPEGQPTAAATP